jgi:rhamnosyltransferase
MSPKLSVIIPTLNAEGYLPRLLGRLSSQTLADRETIVIDSGSDDRTVEMAASFNAEVQTIPRREFNHGGTRNRVARTARGRFLVFLTQDVLPVDDSLLENLTAPLERDQEIAVSYGRQVAYDDAYTIEKFIRTFNYPAESRTRDRGDISGLGVKTFFCSNACAAYRGDVFKQLGGFREDTIMNEDMEFVYRAVMSGYKVHYAADAQVWHSHNYTLLEQFRRYVDIGVFFSDNRELASFARNEDEGKRYLLAASDYLIRNGRASRLPHLFLDTVARFVGYRVGRNYRLLPGRVLRSISMHGNYWLHKRPGEGI